MLFDPPRYDADQDFPKGIEPASARGDRLIAAGLQDDDLAQIIEGVVEYRRALAGSDQLDDWKRAEVENNLGAAMCLVAQKETGSKHAIAALDLARNYLQAALTVRSRADAPEAWALTQANLAVVHLSRFRVTGDPAEIMAGHIAIDGARDVFRQAGNRHWIDWVSSIRMHLVDIMDRRKAPR